MKSPPRYELLFALDDQTADALVASTARRMQSGPSRQSFDDCYYKSTDHKTRKRNAGRRQYRVRRTNRSWDVSLQSMRWEQGRCSLRQTLVAASDLSILRSDAINKSWAGKWFHKKVLKHNLTPSLATQFDLLTWNHETPDGEVRLTVESNLQASFVANARSRPAATAVATNIVRMNFDVSLPAIFKALIYEFALLPEEPGLPLELFQAAAKKSARATRACSPHMAIATTDLGGSRRIQTPAPSAPAKEVALCQLG